jgi:hypothetical protein
MGHSGDAALGFDSLEVFTPPEWPVHRDLTNRHTCAMSATSRLTPLDPVLDLAERMVTVAHLIRNATLYAVSGGDDSEVAYRRLMTLNLDTAPIDEKPIRRFVQREHLAGQSGEVREYAQPIDASVLVAVDLPLAELLDKLSELEFVFVLDRDRVVAIVTRADLQSPLVNLYVLGLLVAAEHALDQLIARYTNNDWERLLSTERFTKILTVYEDRQKTNTEVDLLACSNLDDRLAIAAQLPRVREFLGWTSHTNASNGFKVIKRVRNCLAHGDSLLAAVPDPVEALAAVTSIRSLAERAWQLVGADETLWEIYAATTLFAEIDGETVTLNGPEAAEWPWPAQEAWILTAANPMSLTTTKSQNQRNNQALAEDLRESRFVPVPALGRTGSWEERSWLVVGAPEDLILSLGRAYGQRAVYHLHAETVEVVACETGETMECTTRRE